MAKAIANNKFNSNSLKVFLKIKNSKLKNLMPN